MRNEVRKGLATQILRHLKMGGKQEKSETRPEKKEKFSIIVYKVVIVDC